MMTMSTVKAVCAAVIWMLGAGVTAMGDERADRPAPTSVADPPQSPASTQPSQQVVKTVLFMDWYAIDKGKLSPTYDPDRLTDEARKTLEKTRAEWNIEYKTTGHGMEPVRIPHGIRITTEKAHKSQPWLVPDRPWEEVIRGGGLIHEQGRYRLWYTAGLAKRKQEVVYDKATGRGMEISGSAMCYAESTDGMNWVKPSLGLVSFNGSKDNNIVAAYGLAIPFRDDKGPPEERYKAFVFDELPTKMIPDGAPPFNRYGLYGLVSPDGFHWTRLDKPLVRYFCDTWNIGAYDAALGKYVGYFRGHVGGRAITRAETDDFRNWPVPLPALTAGPEDGASDDYYSSAYTTYPGEPSIRLLFPAIYNRGTDRTEVRAAISRDGRCYNWISHRPVVEVGRQAEWDEGTIYAQNNLVRLPDGRLALPYVGYNHTHNAGFGRYYEDFKSTSGLAWAFWDDGRLAGIEAEKTGEFWVHETALAGRRIEVNARTAPGGSVEIELGSKDEVLEGRSFADAVPFTGDKLWAGYRWKNKTDLSDLQNKPIWLHFRLNKAKVFGYRLVEPRTDLHGANPPKKPATADSTARPVVRAQQEDRQPTVLGLS